MPVNIHGKEYLTVAERISDFRTNDDYKDYAIITELVDNDEYVIIKATIKNASDRVLATGYAQEKYGDGHINQTSALENCETSAIGRALACLGLAGSEFASADEVANAISQQSQGVQYNRASSTKPASIKQKQFINKLYLDAGGEDGMVSEFLKGEGFDPDKLTSAQASELIERLQQ